MRSGVKFAPLFGYPFHNLLNKKIQRMNMNNLPVINITSEKDKEQLLNEEIAVFIVWQHWSEPSVLSKKVAE